MKFLKPPVFLAICLGYGCATQKQETSFESVPRATKLDPVLSNNLARATIDSASMQNRTETNAQGDETSESRPILTPDSGVAGKVMAYNAPGRFVVLGFPDGRLPSLDLHLFVYRNDLKTGEVKITGPQRGNNIVADLVSGEAMPGDEVRDK